MKIVLLIVLMIGLIPFEIKYEKHYYTDVKSILWYYGGVYSTNRVLFWELQILGFTKRYESSKIQFYYQPPLMEGNDMWLGTRFLYPNKKVQEGITPACLWDCGWSRKGGWFCNPCEYDPGYPTPPQA